VRVYLPIIAQDTLAFEPGKRAQYSNSGFILLGAIVEAASGQNYFDYMREHIYRPAGMRDTDCYDLASDPPNLATGYTQIAPDGEPDRVAAGGAMSFCTSCVVALPAAATPPHPTS
jgi:CubicO group peptidase (beta-lactamase class C family)